MIFRRPKHRAEIVFAAPTSFREVPVTQPPLRMRTGGLDDAQRERLALALHSRYHGDYHASPTTLDVECARISGAFDDVAAIEPVILDMLRGR